MPDSSDLPDIVDPILLEVRDVTVEYTNQGIRFAAISDVNLDIAKGETLGLVGESGCGKSTTGRAIIQLPKPTKGSVKFEGQELTSMSHNEMRPIRKRLQIIFQDPVSSLNPRRRVKDIIAEPLIISGMKNNAEIDAKVREVLTAVGKPASGDGRVAAPSQGSCPRWGNSPE